MAQGEGSRTGRIVLIVLGVTALLGLLCCGGGWLLLGDKIQMGFNVGMAFPRMLEDLKTTLGDDVVLLPKESDGGGMVFVIGVGEGEDLADPARVGAIQDLAWEAYVNAFADGAMPIEGLAIGRTVDKAGEDGEGGKRNVVEWRDHVVSLTELEKRTGTAAPPILEGMNPEDLGGTGLKIEYEGDGRTEVDEDE